MREIILIGIICLLVGAIMGGVIAGNIMMNLITTYGLKYLEVNGVNVTLDRSAIAADLWRYKNRISECG